MIVFPMAGLSSRFRNSGYEQPKYMLEAQGLTIFDHSIIGFYRLFAQENFLFIYRNIYQTEEFIKSRIHALGLRLDRAKLVELEAPTSGQAETVALGLQSIKANPDENLTIFNIDTFRPNFKWPVAFDRNKVDGYLEVFEGEGEQWSFVLPDAAQKVSQRVVRVTEKKRISNLCSTGLYFFKRVEFFLKAYRKNELRDITELQGGERYVAPLYNNLIKDGMDIRYDLIDRRHVIFCGTPEEYKKFSNGHH